MGLKLLDVLLLTAAVPYILVANPDECERTQYIEVGSNYTLRCSFGVDFYSVLWYDSVDYITTTPIVMLQEDKIIYDDGSSRDYDITINGSLKIHNVSIIHESTFLAITFERKGSEPSLHYVAVIVTVTPDKDFPLIDVCRNNKSLCFTEVTDDDVITCSVEKARPNITLQWSVRSDISDMYIESQTRRTLNHNASFSSYTTLDVSSLKSKLLSFLVCKAFQSYEVLVKNESAILVQQGSVDYELIQQTQVLVERNSKLTLQCGNDDTIYLVWKKLSEEYITHDYVVATFFDENSQSSSSENLEVKENGALEINQAQIQDGGLYSCTFTDGTINDNLLYNVQVYVNPEPPYPVVDGCSEDRYCLIGIHREGRLSCSLHGVRPVVDIQLRTFFSSDKNKISFFDEKLKITTEKETFDVYLTAQYNFHGSSNGRLTIECIAYPDEDTPLDWSKLFDLILISDPAMSTENVIHTNQLTSATIVKDQSTLFVMMVVLGSALVLMLLLIAIIYQVMKNKNKKQIKTNFTGEMESMIPNHITDFTAKKGLFLQELRIHYEKLCQTICPIPFINEKMFSVDDLYVEGGIEISMSVKHGHHVWKRLDSHHDIFNPELVKSKIRIIIGDPGYGKSTLGIQMVYDWCKGVKISPLSNIEFVIFIRFRQLGKIKSLFEAIKLFLLPIDSQLTVTDVETIIRKSTSTLLILDGYDEIVDISEYLKSDFCHILARTKLQQLHVVVTTRTHCYPKKIAPSNILIRLSGFDHEARTRYTKKAFVASDENATHPLLESVQKNPIHGDICEIPFLFVMYVHIIQETGTEMMFDTVTSFFRYIIKCFHSHHINKYNDDLNAIATVFEKNHAELDEVAFSGLAGDENVSWNRGELLSKIGKDFYECYVLIGILVVEEILFYVDKYSALSSDIIQRKPVVRFFHKLIGEWYAAHYLATQIKSKSSSAVREILKQLDPFNLQYVYRFTCGIDSDAADRIIQYLKTIKDGEKLAILCLLEMSGTVDNIKATIKEMCDEIIYISLDHSRFLQRSTVQLIEMASRVQIPMRCINLEKCFHLVDSSKSRITLSSGLQLPSLSMVKQLKFTEIGREMTYDEFNDLLQYSVICEGLEQLT
ncbi:hypothetical protein BSL78_11533 [Apostichopus japonicus]|uniref:NACHT domain-containing protein n=1 Tax=Stichopus japonicus TaxID=307972 RepID=A0A2G8KU97_STIJA|nr:hypothetical protein BSL78_11533 [Apostichopus japonicus]